MYKRAISWYNAIMNIFILSYDPREAAQQLCDLHVNKMGLEAAQMLSTALHLCGIKGVSYDASAWKDRWDDPERSTIVRAYRPTHTGHPCTKWTCGLPNYNWLRKHAEAIFDEHEFRFGRRPHTAKVVEQLPRFEPVQGPLRFVLAMPDHLKHSNPIVAYRRYYKHSKLPMAKWTRRNPPEWLQHDCY